MKWRDLQRTLKRDCPDRVPSELEQFVDGDCDVFEHTFQTGEDLKPPEAVGRRPWLAVLISGRAEIYETSSYRIEFGAYRPIRVLVPGDIIGLFTIADALLSDREPSASKEGWRVSAGSISSLIAYKKQREGEPERYSFELCRAVTAEYNRKLSHAETDGHPIYGSHFGSTFYPHMVTTIQDISAGTTFSARIAYFTFNSVNEIADNPEFMTWLLKSSLTSTNPYRLCQNIYSESFYRTLAKVVFARYDFKDDMTPKDVHWDAMFPHFVDGVSQALDAFIHDDPMYYPTTWHWESASYRVTKKRKWVSEYIYSNDILIADHPRRRRDSDAIYPIGIGNYHINLNLEVERTNRGGGFFEDAGTFLYPKYNVPPVGFRLYTYFANILLEEYFSLYRKLLDHEGRSSVSTRLDGIQRRVSVCTDLWGVGGRRVLALKIARETPA